MRRSTSARYAPVPQQGSSTYTFSPASPSAIPRSSLRALSTRAHVADDLGRGVPHAQLLAQIGIESL